MGKSRNTPLARGIIGGEVGSIYGQLEVFLINNKRIKIVIRRKPYSGRSDINFSMACHDLQDFIDILQDANEQLDVKWLSRVALAELKSR